MGFSLHADTAATAGEDLLELVMRRYEETSTLITSRTGASCSATLRRSPRCSAAFCTTRTE
jgi:hypothetical protein